jgi:vacuolar-type H+-ATPase subunit H
MPKPTRRVPEDPGKPTPREAIAKATAAAGPKVAKAMEAATPKVEQAATKAGKLLGTLRDRARITAREFADAYNAGD